MLHTSLTLAALAALLALPGGKKFPTKKPSKQNLPSGSLPGQPIPTKPVQPKPGPAQVQADDGEDLVKKVPKTPAKLKSLLVHPNAFRGSGHIPLMAGKGGSSGANYLLFAPVELPLGATIKWMDCRVDRDRSDNSKPASGTTVRAHIRTSNYRTDAADRSFGGFDIRFGRSSGMFWRGKKINPTDASLAHVGKDEFFLVMVSINRKARENVWLRGCRIGYSM